MSFPWFPYQCLTTCLLLSELPIRPIVVLAGDDRQLQPIENIKGTIQTTESVMTLDKLKNINMKVVLTQQNRSEDEKYMRFLDHIRVWQPSQKLLNLTYFKLQKLL